MSMIRTFVPILLALVPVCMVPGPAMAAWQGYMLVTDGEGYAIEGPDLTPDALPNAMRVAEFHHLVTTDEGTTAPYHKPLVITKLLDKTSARFFQAFAEEEPLTVLLKLYSQGQLLFEIELDDARIVAIEPISESMAPEEALELEKLRFIYRTITVRDVAGGTATVWTLAEWPA